MRQNEFFPDFAACKPKTIQRFLSTVMESLEQIHSDYIRMMIESLMYKNLCHVEKTGEFYLRVFTA